MHLRSNHEANSCFVGHAGHEGYRVRLFQAVPGRSGSRRHPGRHGHPRAAGSRTRRRPQRSLAAGRRKQRGGSTPISRAMQTLPVGVPKLLVSTVASGDTRPYVGDTDIAMMNSIVDIAGINRISSRIIANAAGAVAGMAKVVPPEDTGQRPVVGATMFGLTTPCVTTARQYLEERGYEVIVFHATGSGGRALENLVDAGMVDAMLDITTTELADNLVGGVFSAGPERLTAAARAGIPQVVSVGGIHMGKFGASFKVTQKL